MGHREDAYRTLGLSHGADETEIKKAYRKMAMKHHPDKGGDPSKFKDITNAYETLTKPEEPDLPDSVFGGGAGVFHFGGMPFGFDAFGIGGMRGMGGVPPKPKRKVVTNYVTISLDKIATGVTKKFAIKHSTKCDMCQHKCPRCGGSGLVKKITEQILGRQRIIQQNTVRCDECVDGLVTSNRRCEMCLGKRVVEHSQEITIDVDKGAREGKKWVFDETSPDIVYHFVLKYEKHPVFDVRNDDLIVKRSLPFRDTLRDMLITEKHPLGNEVTFRTSDVSTIIHTGTTHRVNGQGLVFGRGAMVFEFTVTDYPRLNAGATGCNCGLTGS